MTMGLKVGDLALAVKLTTGGEVIIPLGTQIPLIQGTRGVFSTGEPATRNITYYIGFATLGEVSEFGSLKDGARSYMAGCGSDIRGIFAGGGDPHNSIDYFIFSSGGETSDFGDLTVARGGLGACSSAIRGVFGGGFIDPTQYSWVTNNTIDYITLATTGNALDFGDLTLTRATLASCSSATRGVFGGGYPASQDDRLNTIDYITFSSLINATDFGDLTVARNGLAACSSTTRGIFVGGYTTKSLWDYVNTIDYITLSTLGNAADFGDLTLTRGGLAGCSSATRGVFAGGFYNGTWNNTMDHITLATLGDAADFGDLSEALNALAACSNSVKI